MLYQVEALKTDIRIALDQNMTSDQLFDTGDIDTLSLEDIIESKIADAARIVENGAPRHLLEGGKNFGDSISWDSAVGYGSGRILLPDDFMRLVSFQMSDWSRPCTVAITEDARVYLPLAELVDVEKELARIAKELKRRKARLRG